MTYPRRLPSLIAALVGIAGVIASAGCADTLQPASDGGAFAIAGVDARLQGDWRLQSFVPATPLEPMLQAFVTFQYGNLSVRLDRGRFTADSPGVHLSRTYRLHDAYGDRFKVTTFDEQGVPYDAACTFIRPDVLEVSSWTDPWRGVATFQRAGATAWAPPPLPPPR